MHHVSMDLFLYHLSSNLSAMSDIADLDELVIAHVLLHAMIKSILNGGKFVFSKAWFASAVELSPHP